MVELPQTELPTITKIYEKYKTNNGDWRRDHLGASIIGRHCERSIYYSFRWTNDPQFPSRILRLFESGFREESRIIKNLRDIGITVYSQDPDSGTQINFKEPTFGHFSGSVDGIAQGFEEAPKAWHILECKTSSSKAFNKLVKEGVEAAKPEHHSQMMVYMHWAKLDRAYYLVCCKEDDRLYGERVYFDKEEAQRLVDKARRVIFSDTPPERITSSAGNFQCRFCDHHGVCWDKELPEVNCRTCAFVTPEENGTWTCGRIGEVIEPINQRKACEGHIYIPDLVPLVVVDSDPEVGSITYEGGITNGPGHTLSVDMARVMREIKKC
jgi:hypothetical protein